MTMTIEECIGFLKSERDYCHDTNDQYFIDRYTDCIVYMEKLQEDQ